MTCRATITARSTQLKIHNRRKAFPVIDPGIDDDGGGKWKQAINKQIAVGKVVLESI